MSETSLAGYKNTAASLGTSVENMLGNIDSTRSSSVQGDLGLTTLKQEKNAKLSEVETKKSEVEMQRLVNGAMLGSGNLQAPFSGVVSEKYVEEGSFVNVGTPIYKVTNDSALKIVVDVPVEMVNDISKDTGVEVLLAGKILAAKIKRIHPTVNKINNKISVEIELENVAENIRPGVTCQVVFLKNENSDKDGQQIKIPKTSVVTRYGEVYVFVLDGEVVKKQAVKLGNSDDVYVEVLEGLSSGREVVNTSVEDLRDGDKVSLLK